MQPDISICIPVYHSEETIKPLVERVKECLNQRSLEIILVNDGSKDQSHRVCLELEKDHPEVRYFELSKNFGEHNAVMCALTQSTGKVAVIIDDDFQNPPEEILKLVQETQKGYDVVYSKYTEKKHNLFRNIGSRINNLFATWLLNKPYHLYLSSFKAINRATIDEIVKYQGPFPYIDGLILRITDKIHAVEVQHNERKTGRSNYTLKKLISLWLNMFINFSIKPLRFFTLLGVILSFLGFIMTSYLVIRRILNPDEVRGWTSLIAVIMSFSGLQIVFLGLIAEYIGKNYLTITKTPAWIIRNSKNSTNANDK